MHWTQLLKILAKRDTTIIILNASYFGNFPVHLLMYFLITNFNCYNRNLITLLVNEIILSFSINLQGVFESKLC